MQLTVHFSNNIEVRETTSPSSNALKAAVRQQA